MRGVLCGFVLSAPFLWVSAMFAPPGHARHVLLIVGLGLASLVVLVGPRKPRRLKQKY